MPLPRRSAVFPLVLAAAAALSGCAGTVSLEAPPDAGDPACADVMTLLPESVGGQDRRWTDAQSTAAWGDPTAVIFACGVTPPGPTEARCITVKGLDWIVDESNAPTYRVTSYGTEPALELVLDNETVQPTAVIDAISVIAASRVERERECVSTGEVLP